MPSIGSSSAERHSDPTDLPLVWDSLDNTYNPLNWSRPRKLRNVIVVVLLGTVSPFASTAIAPALEQVIQSMRVTNMLTAPLIVSIFVLGYAFGQALVSPFADTFGRRIVQHTSAIFFVLLKALCAACQTSPQLLACRFFAGFFGSGLLSIGGNTIGDIYNEEERGGVMAFFVLGINVGPVLGPIACGSVAQKAGFRWVFGFVALVAAAVTIISLLLLDETHPATIARKAHKRHIRFENVPIQTHAITTSRGYCAFWTQFAKHGLTNPVTIVLRHPVLLLLSFELALIYGYLYLLFVSFGTIFIEVYHEDTSIAGLNFIAFGVGTVLGLLMAGASMDKIYKKLSGRREDGHGIPEFRMPLLVPGSILVPSGLLVYGWTADRRIFWILPDIGVAIFAAGFMMSFLGVQLYIIDAFRHNASAIGGANILRCLAGGLLPLAGPRMFSALGTGWGCSLLALVAAVTGIPIPWVVLRYGESMRKKFE